MAQFPLELVLVHRIHSGFRVALLSILDANVRYFTSVPSEKFLTAATFLAYLHLSGVEKRKAYE